MKLFILESPHACGKTTLLNKLKKISNEDLCNLNIIDENYLELKRFDCDSVLHQIDWVLNWAESVISMCDKGKDLVICDRGPMSVIIYGSELYGSDIFTNIVNEIFRTLKEKGITITNMRLENPPFEEHKSRIFIRNGPLMTKELENLEYIINRYKDLCKDYILVKNLDEVIDCILK
jgi:thymidylate kinase